MAMNWPMGTGSLAELGLFLAELGLFLAMLGRLVILDLVVGLVLASLDLEFLAAMALPVVLLAASLLWATMAAGTWRWWQWHSGACLDRKLPTQQGSMLECFKYSNKYYMSAI